MVIDLNNVQIESRNIPDTQGNTIIKITTYTYLGLKLTDDLKVKLTPNTPQFAQLLDKTKSCVRLLSEDGAYVIIWKMLALLIFEHEEYQQGLVKGDQVTSLI